MRVGACRVAVRQAGYVVLLEVFSWHERRLQEGTFGHAREVGLRVVPSTVLLRYAPAIMLRYEAERIRGRTVNMRGGWQTVGSMR